MTLMHRHGTSETSGTLDRVLSDASLTTSLGRIFGTRVELVSREGNVFSSVAPSEIVRLRTPDGDIRLLAKYQTGAQHHTGHGFWGDISYEARVYGRLLDRMDVTAPRRWGIDETTSPQCLFIEYVDGERLSKSPREALISVAHWLGEFHRAGEALVADGSAGFINILDAGYFTGWARRTREFARPLHASKPWLPRVCDAFEAASGSLAAAPSTIVHGEFYPRNILVNGDGVFPVDWQSAAIGLAEIDVASMIEGWGQGDIVATCLREYARSRWPHQAEPSQFRGRLDLARVYWPLRWLGDEAAWTLSPRRAHYFDELLDAARDAGLYPDGGSA